MKYLKAIKILGVLIFIYILSMLDYKIVIESISGLNISYLLTYAAIWYLFFFAKVYRWHIIQNYFTPSHKLTFNDNLLASIETLFLSYITPAKIGDITKLWIIKERYGIEKKDSLVVYIFDRIQDLYFMALFALFSLLFIISLDISIYVYMVLAMCVALYLLKNVLLEKVTLFFQSHRKIHTTVLFETKVILINLFVFALYFLQSYILAKAMNLNIEFPLIVTVLSISAIISLIPVSINGLGIREGVFIFLLASTGVKKEEAVMLSLLDNVFFVAIFTIALYLPSMIYLKKYFKM